MIDIASLLSYLKVRHPELEDDPEEAEDTLIYYGDESISFQVGIMDGDLVVHTRLPLDAEKRGGEHETRLDPDDPEVEDRVIELADRFVEMAEAAAGAGEEVLALLEWLRRTLSRQYRVGLCGEDIQAYRYKAGGGSNRIFLALWKGEDGAPDRLQVQVSRTAYLDFQEVLASPDYLDLRVLLVQLGVAVRPSW